MFPVISSNRNAVNVLIENNLYEVKGLRVKNFLVNEVESSKENVIF